MSDDLASARHQLIALLRRGRCLVGGGFPFNWRPREVIDPRWDQPFTGPGAWEFILSLLESDQCLEQVTLDDPPGRSGYVMLVKLAPNKPRLYVKLQLGSGWVIARSFHYSEFD